ncbi:MAG TPA: hypothetical protein VI589_09975, partial [Vicinamibacteria bacterium]
MKSEARRLAFLLACALLPPLVAALLGTERVRNVALNLGPGDGPFTSGFSIPRPESFDPYEIQDGVATHWTTHEARVTLPLVVEAPAVGLALRFARHFPDRGRLEVRLPTSAAVGFDVVKGYETYETTLAVPGGATPLDLALQVLAGGDDRGLGVSLDWVHFELPARSRVRLTGSARFRALLGTGLLLVVLWAAGTTAARAAAVSVVPGLILAGGLLFDPWLVHRLLRGVPEALLLLLPLAWLCRVALGRPTLWPALLLLVALPRAVLVNHPDYYYPDLMIHARIAKLMAREGLMSLAHPDLFLGRFQEARNSVAGFPYSIVFHVPLALWNPAYDTALCALRVGGAFLSALPVLLGALLLRRLGLSAYGVFLLAVAPTYPHWLFHATLPALFGHVFDLLLLAWLVSHVEELDRTRTFLIGALLVGAAQLAYAYGLPVTALLVAFLALFLALRDGRGRALAVRVLLMGALGAALALAIYYRHFVAGAWAAFAGLSAPPLFPGGATGTTAATLGGRVLLPLADAARFFDTVWPLLALAGLVALWREPPNVVLRAYGATVVSLVAARALFPGIFRWNHELLLLTPLLSLLAGEALGRLSARGRAGKVAAGLLLGVVAVHALSR